MPPDCPATGRTGGDPGDYTRVEIQAITRCAIDFLSCSVSPAGALGQPRVRALACAAARVRAFSRPSARPALHPLPPRGGATANDSEASWMSPSVDSSQLPFTTTTQTSALPIARRLLFCSGEDEVTLSGALLRRRPLRPGASRPPTTSTTPRPLHPHFTFRLADKRKVGAKLVLTFRSVPEEPLLPLSMP